MKYPLHGIQHSPPLFFIFRELCRDDDAVETRRILHQWFTETVFDDTARGGEKNRPEAVALGHLAVIFSLPDIQIRETTRKDNEQSNHDQKKVPDRTTTECPLDPSRFGLGHRQDGIIDLAW